MDDFFNDFDFNLSRADLLAVLNDFGVGIPKDSKLSDVALQKRLTQALDAIQATPGVLPKLPVNVNKLERWPEQDKVFNFIRRVNIDETEVLWKAKMMGVADPIPVFQNAFRDMRETIWSIAENYDKGWKAHLVQDRQCQKSAVVMRVRVGSQTRIARCG